LRYRWLLFDADGTLFDYDGAEGAALELTLAEVGYEMRVETRAIYRRVNMALWHDLEAGAVDAATLRYRRFERLFVELGLPVERAKSASEHNLVELARHGQLLPEAESVVRALAPERRMAIITNGLADVQRRRLGDSAIAELFETITISDEIGAAKPDPHIIDLTLARLGDPPRSEVLMIGDSLSSDIQGGINAGIDTCWLSPDGDEAPEEQAPTYTIRTLRDLVEIANGRDALGPT
jgi:YjjG family noncanonical pyrimidine nucleotidase